MDQSYKRRRVQGELREVSKILLQPESLESFVLDVFIYRDLLGRGGSPLASWSMYKGERNRCSARAAGGSARRRRDGRRSGRSCWSVLVRRWLLTRAFNGCTSCNGEGERGVVDMNGGDGLMVCGVWGGCGMVEETWT